MYNLKYKQVIGTRPGTPGGAARERICTWRRRFTPCAVKYSLLEEVNNVTRNAVPGDVLLLSPACSSFDQFRNYQHRSDVFRQTDTEGGNVNHIPLYVEKTKPTMVQNNFLLCFGFFEEKPRRNSTVNNQPPQRKDANQRQRQ